MVDMKVISEKRKHILFTYKKLVAYCYTMYLYLKTTHKNPNATAAAIVVEFVSLLPDCEISGK